MSLLDQALRAGHAPTAPRTTPRVLVAGGGGALGAALLEQLLARGGASVLVSQPLHAAVRGLQAVPWAGDAPTATGPEHSAVVVYDRERHANGRDEAFYRPQPEQLPALARWLQARGVRHLLVVMPHTQASLPEALKRGLASLDEQAVAALGFEHLVFMRSAQAPAALRDAALPQRMANWMLAQLHFMVPASEKPVRAQKVAEFAALLIDGLGDAPPGTRVVPAEVVWEAAQSRDVARVAQAWLSGRALPQTPPPAARM